MLRQENESTYDELEAAYKKIQALILEKNKLHVKLKLQEAFRPPVNTDQSKTDNDSE